MIGSSSQSNTELSTQNMRLNLASQLVLTNSFSLSGKASLLHYRAHKILCGIRPWAKQGNFLTSKPLYRPAPFAGTYALKFFVIQTNILLPNPNTCQPLGRCLIPCNSVIEVPGQNKQISYFQALIKASTKASASICVETFYLLSNFFSPEVNVIKLFCL